MSVSDEVLSFAPWSPTMLDLALDCPFAFRKKYVEHEKELTESSEDMNVGSVVHHILEWVARGQVTVDRALQQALESFAEKLTHEATLRVRTFREAVKDFSGWMERCQQQNGIQEKLFEQALAVTRDFTLTGYKASNALLRGKLDLLIYTPHPIAIIIDHKTGLPLPIDRHRHQLQVYSLLVDAHRPGLKAIRTGLHYLSKDPDELGNRTVWAPEYPLPVLRTRIRQEIEECLEHAAANVREPIANPTWRCKNCGYQTMCPAMTK
jgi:CRISPR/Cas system-associated exonuclease Cas4 (RecB family)